MGKLFNTLVLSGVISIVLLVFDGSGLLSPIGQLFLSPSGSWGTFISNALASILGVTTLIGGAITIGGLLTKQDWLFRLGFFTVVTSWVETPFIQLWTFLSSKTFPLDTCTNAFTCATLVNGEFTTLGMILASIVVGPMILYALWACWSQIWSPETSG